MPNSARMAHLALLHWPNASLSGAFDWVPSSFIFTKAGLSESCIRIQTEMPRSRTDTRKGMRQPAIMTVEPASPRKSAGVMDDWTNKITISDMNRPMVAVV